MVLLEPLVLVDIVAAAADTPAVVVVGIVVVVDIVVVVVVQADSRPVGDSQTMSCCQF